MGESLLNKTIMFPASVFNGGTGTSLLPVGDILIGNGTSAVTTIPTLPISKGGTGGTTTIEALTQLGLTVESGNWTPSLLSNGNTPADLSYFAQVGFYFRIGRLVYITCKVGFTLGQDSPGKATIAGLPYASASPYMDKAHVYGLSTFAEVKIREAGAGSVKGRINESSTRIQVMLDFDLDNASWREDMSQTIGFSGCYIKANN